MKQIKHLLVLSLFVLVALSFAGCFALEEAEEVSQTPVAPTIAAQPTTAATTPAQEATAAPTTAPAEATSTYGESEATAVPTTAAVATDLPASVARIYEIDSTQSEARFYINEVLRGSDVTVVGVSKIIAGQLSVDMSNPATSQIGEILINARDFKTDNDFRNNAIKNKILLTDANEFISFLPKSLTGLPAQAEMGQSYSFQIVGDLTLIGTTKEVIFDATVTPISADQISGTVSTVINYADFGIQIPLSQSVTAVEDTVKLELGFIANVKP